MIVVPSIINDVGEQVDRDKIEKDLVNKRPALAYERGVVGGLIHPELEKAIFRGGNTWSDDLALFIKHYVDF